MKYLVFRLFGPFASWGDIAVGEHRPTLDAPTKSAVLGLVAGALGWQREDNDERHIDLDAALGMAAVVHETGRWLRDFHTAMEPEVKAAPCYATRKEEIEWPLEHFKTHGQANSKFNEKALSTDITRRDYRVDARATLLLWRRDGHAPNAPGLEQLASALARPTFVPYLGRKANPLALPMHPILVEADTLREAIVAGLHKLPTAPFAARTREMAGTSVRYDVDHPAPGLTSPRSRHTRRDRVHSRDTRRWQFLDRQEIHQAWDQKGGA